MTQRVPFPFTPEDEAKVARCLREEELLAFPTETVYGLGGNALSETVVQRVYAAKGRAVEKALPVLATPEQVRELAIWDDSRIDGLMAKFWPGPLTLVLPVHPELPEFLRGPNGTIAVRHSSAPAVQALLELGGKPLIGTSANRSGQPSCRSADAVAEQLGDALDLLVDGGPASETRPSTLVRWDGESFEILREGVLPSSALAPFLLLASGGIPTQATGAGVPPRATRKSGDSQ